MSVPPFVGIDIEQFFRDPYATGIQRVLQYVALQWPSEVPAEFIVPDPDTDGMYFSLSTECAAGILTLPFAGYSDRLTLRSSVHTRARSEHRERFSHAELLERYTTWLLPEVSYLPSVISRFEEFRRRARTAMIGYDILPMTEPANYRFPPGRSAWVSEYFRMLAVADAVVCISEYSRREILGRLRRPGSLVTTVAHPGGDHLPVRAGLPPERTRFIRVGTLESRKLPREILASFTEAVDRGLEADLMFVGAPSASDADINDSLIAAIDRGYPVTWIQGASDSEVYDLIQTSSAFLSFGTEGYGIPVLEAIRVGTPVLFDGEQPAAELMTGKGATRCDIARFYESASRAAISPEYSCKPQEVPRWHDFTTAVVNALEND